MMEIHFAPREPPSGWGCAWPSAAKPASGQWMVQAVPVGFCSAKEKPAPKRLLLLPSAEQQLEAGASEAAYATANRAAEIGDQFGDADLSACARHVQGRVLHTAGRGREGAGSSGRGDGGGYRRENCHRS